MVAEACFILAYLEDTEESCILVRRVHYISPSVRQHDLKKDILVRWRTLVKLVL